MKTKIIIKLILTAIIILNSSKIFSQLIEENFEYPEGSLLTNHGWTANTGADTNEIAVTSPGLTFGNYGYSDIGLAATLKRNGQDVFKNFNPQNAGSIYLTIMVKVDSVSLTALNGDYFAAFLPSNSSSNYNARLYARAWDGGVAFGVSKTAFESGSIFFTNAYPKNTTLLLVLKYTFNTTGTSDDRVDLYVFTSSIPVFEPENSTVSALGTDDDPSDLGRFALIQGSAVSSPVLKVDGISVTTSWESVLPAELTSFTSTVSGRNVQLNWTTNSEINNLGFEIERSANTDAWVKSGFIKGAGNYSGITNYNFKDAGLNPGNYNYRLKQIDFNGDYRYHNLQNDVKIGTPDKYILSQNYPNPFNPVTNLEFGIPESGFVSLKVFDILGKEVATLVNEKLSTGRYETNFDGSNLTSGVYFYKLEVNGFSEVKSMILIK